MLEVDTSNRGVVIDNKIKSEGNKRKIHLQELKSFKHLHEDEGPLGFKGWVSLFSSVFAFLGLSILFLFLSRYN